jgi:hypothetical protein
VLSGMEALRTGGGGGGGGWAAEEEGGAAAQQGRGRALLLLTDGQPNITPPRGHIAELRNYMDQHR